MASMFHQGISLLSFLQDDALLVAVLISSDSFGVQSSQQTVKLHTKTSSANIVAGKPHFIRPGQLAKGTAADVM